MSIESSTLKHSINVYVFIFLLLLIDRRTINDETIVALKLMGSSANSKQNKKKIFPHSFEHRAKNGSDCFNASSSMFECMALRNVKICFISLQFFL